MSFTCYVGSRVVGRRYTDLTTSSTSFVEDGVAIIISIVNSSSVLSILETPFPLFKPLIDYHHYWDSDSEVDNAFTVPLRPSLRLGDEVYLYSLVP
jgi:hypothetical protein